MVLWLFIGFVMANYSVLIWYMGKFISVDFFLGFIGIVLEIRVTVYFRGRAE